MQANAFEKGTLCLWVYCNRAQNVFEGLVREIKFKAKYDYFAEKLKNVLIK